MRRVGRIAFVVIDVGYVQFDPEAVALLRIMSPRYERTSTIVRSINGSRRERLVGEAEPGQPWLTLQVA